MQSSVETIDSGFPNKSLWPAAYLEKFNVCRKPCSIFSALGGSTTQPTTITGDWKLYEDRKGKPGWIAVVPRSELTIPVCFGKKPRMSVTYLRSYEKLGNMDMFINGKKVTLHGLWHGHGPRVSQKFTVWSAADSSLSQQNIQDNIFSIGLSIQPNTSHNVSFVLAGGFKKMKLISVVTC